MAQQSSQGTGLVWPNQDDIWKLGRCSKVFKTVWRPLNALNTRPVWDQFLNTWFGCTCQPNPYWVTLVYLVFQIKIWISNPITICGPKLWKLITNCPKMSKAFRSIQNAFSLLTPPKHLTDDPHGEHSSTGWGHGTFLHATTTTTQLLQCWLR